MQSEGLRLGVSREMTKPMKPVGRFLLWYLQVTEPFQQVLLGGSCMAWLRFTADINHKFAHLQGRFGIGPKP